MKHPFFVSAFILIMVGIFPATGTAAGAIGPKCTLKGKRLYGKVQVTSFYPDFRVRVSDLFPDLHVQKVKDSTLYCGQWRFVKDTPDFTVQFVDDFPDFTIRFVNHTPGAQ